MRVFFRCVVAGRAIHIPAPSPGETDRYVALGMECALYAADSVEAVLAEKLKHIEQELLPFDAGAEFDLGTADADVTDLCDLTDSSVLSGLGITAVDLIQDASISVPPSAAFRSPRRVWSVIIANDQHGVFAPSAAYHDSRIVAVRASRISVVLSDFQVTRIRIPLEFVDDPKRTRGQRYS